MNRIEFLKNFWTPYPAMPDAVVAAGRIYDLKAEGQTLLIELIRDQEFIRLQFSESPKNSEFLAVGDIIAVTKENQIVLLAPQLQSLPKRNFDKMRLMQWQKFLQSLRRFFDAQKFLEIKTPTLVPCPGTEPSLDVFSTEFIWGSQKKKFYLPTSPELHLKKMLSLGADKIFEIAPCFRNGEITEKHQPEFLMLEWYRAFASLKEIKQDVIELISYLAQELEVAKPLQVISFSVAELFKIHCDFEFTPQTSLPHLQALAKKMNVDVRSAETIDDYFFLIFMEKIESQLPAEALVFVEKYPPYQAALARLTEDGWGDRFEAYWRGMELANAFNELNNPIIQKQRALEDLQKKQQMQKEVVTLDDEFFQCLEAGLPPSGGIALGIERLFMALTEQRQIKNLRVFPI